MVQPADGPAVLLTGTGEMPVQCADILVRHGFDIAGIHGDGPLESWAAAHGLPDFYRRFEDFDQRGRTIPYDYLFSVVNFRILKPELFQRARRLAINYHDAPLPRYAGSNATAWALHNREKEHGVTWHVIEERVDAGDILKQRTFRIAPGDTRADLDRKCYLMAMRAFDELLRELKTGTLVRTPQDLDLRTFYHSRDLPPGAPGGGGA